MNRRRLLGLGVVAGTVLLLGPARGATARRLLGGQPDREWLAITGAGDPQRGGPPLARSEDAAPVEVASTPEAPTDVALVGPDEALRFLAGRHPRYPGANLDSLMGFSPAVILETMDTVVLDDIHARRGWDALARVYAIIAEQTLESLLEVYQGQPVVLALDAGHGGRRGVFYDPGSNGTEDRHNRAVVTAIEALATEPRYAGLTIRRIFNDEIGDDFGLPPPNDRKGAAALTLRNVRAAMLTHETARRNNAIQGGDNAPPAVAVHVVSVHFNAGSGGTLVLHQGDTVAAPFRELSVAYAAAYVTRAREALNNSGLLPYRLGLAMGGGLSDDHVLYEPMMRTNNPINPFTGVDRSRFPRRYAMLQTSLLQRDYADGALRYHGLV